MSDPAALNAAIAALHAQRGLLGDVAVDAAIAALRNATAATPGASGAATTQRVRQLSVLFVDVADSTQLLHAVGVDEVPAIVDAAVKRFAALVQQHGGEVLRFTGDGLKAAFGTQDTREDEAERAVRAGLAILDAAEAHAAHLRADFGLHGFAIRVGIHTGAVVLGGGAEADRSAIGQAVHLAARMEQSAPIGRLRISQDTHAQVRGLFQVEAQPLLQVKGVEQALQTWLVLGTEHDAERAVRRGIEGVDTPMVGRDAELQTLLARHARCCREHSLGAVMVFADAGVGKTRLRRELLLRLNLQHDGQGLLQARAHPDGTMQAYGLLRQMVARWFAIADDLDGASARARLVAGLAPWLGERGAMRAQIIGQLLGHDFAEVPAVQALSPRELREAAFAALIEALHAVAAAAPLVVVLDDLHWADSASLDWIQRMARPAPVPLLLVLLARPALRERRTDPLVTAEPTASIIELAPLVGTQGPALASALLRPLADAPPELHGLLVQRAEGNPFYMEELLRMLIDDGVIDAHQTPWRLRGRWQAHARVPATLVGVLQARLDALPADELVALQEASIVGPVFWDSALATIDAAAPQRLLALTTRRFVVERGGSAFAQARELAFHHQLLHDVTYDTVLAPARREGHARVARWMAERVADRAGEFLGITAGHFERAGDSAQALEYYDRARFDAERRYAHDAILAYCERALRQPALVAPMWRFQLHSSRQNTLDALGRVAEAQQALDEMAALAEAENNDAMRADLASTQMLRADREGRAADAEQLAQRAAALAKIADAPSAGALGHGELAWLALMRDDHVTTERQLEQGLVYARRAAQLPWREGGYAYYETQLRAIAIESLLMRERFFDAERAVRDALAVLPIRLMRDRVQLLLRQARAAAGSGDLPTAIDAAGRASALAIDIAMPRLQADVCCELANLMGMLGDRPRQQEYADQADALARTSEHAAGIAAASGCRAELALALGRHAQARALWAEQARLAAELGVTSQGLEARAGIALADATSSLEPQIALAAASVRELLAQAAATSAELAINSSPWPHATNAMLLRAMDVMTVAQQPEATALRAELRRRLADQLAQAPDDTSRQRLVQALPWWRAVASP